MDIDTIIKKVSSVHYYISLTLFLGGFVFSGIAIVLLWIGILNSDDILTTTRISTVFLFMMMMAWLSETFRLKEQLRQQNLSKG